MQHSGQRVHELRRSTIYAALNGPTPTTTHPSSVKQARRPFEGRIDCDRPRAASVDLATEPRPLTCTRPRTSIQRSRKTADLPAAMGLSKKMQSYPVSDIFNPNRHLPHPPTSERCSDFQKSSVIVDHPLGSNKYKEVFLPRGVLETRASLLFLSRESFSSTDSEKEGFPWVLQEELTGACHQTHFEICLPFVTDAKAEKKHKVNSQFFSSR